MVSIGNIVKCHTSGGTQHVRNYQLCRLPSDIMTWNHQESNLKQSYDSARNTPKHNIERMAWGIFDIGQGLFARVLPRLAYSANQEPLSSV
ncbi:hypothetical protein CONLIGDRAFT_632405 [Coniochaeta ligniaria NRRL 30616]|uniref:Uncharacterized protein n=1 Tax=Coniochaeta ligniaria NRRL 30616 TaxID=1408157 RepID=A0A1J7IRS4_9PEZI|nr:hypothetical protein CONLIGDRAFT_632405 [Coniochaeta ligniaria NRRL 30616]